MTACPSGWHLPSDGEWTILSDFLGGAAGGKLKETGYTHWYGPNTGATNSSGFTALPGGFRDSYSETFWDLGYYGDWWTSTEYSSGSALDRHLINDNDQLLGDTKDKPDGLSVRCLKN